MRRQWPLHLARVIPPVILEEPWALFVKGLCLLSGLTTFLGPKPGSIEALLPTWAVYSWSASLIAGAGFGLVGMLVDRWWYMEVTGLIWLGTASGVYALSILTRFGLLGAFPAAVTLAFGAAALVRALGVYVVVELARERARGVG